ncbi:ABCB family ABC transporter ATP-binding protein/permease [Asaia bogorensis]|uniref:ABCB family ABC transporter ATP-binding protein/permease n=1 Tax=Asaia bogorensis TaxID=91915 RepID=UPI0028544686|nr:ABC transporter transmembrane domain-containing protein [Asaia bogorensis]MDR6181691.1 ABC-type transport system involved in Fe-S cluster assembly fused permease/ATPase subunit [Asaia bogorensis NBRC 16594]
MNLPPSRPVARPLALPLALSSLLRAWRLVLSHDIRFFRIGMGLTLALLVAERLCILGTPYMFSRLVAHYATADLRVVVPAGLILGYGGLIFFRSVFSALQELVYQPVGQRLQALTAQAAFHHLLDLPYRFHRDRQTGALTRAIERGSEAADTLLRLALFNILPAILDTGLTVAVVFYFLGGRYACVILVALLSYIILAQWFVRQRVRARRQRNEANGKAQHFLLDSLLNFEAVRHFANEPHEYARYEQARREQEKASLRMTFVAGLSSVSQNAMIALATLAIFFMAGRDLATGRLDVAAFVLIGTYLRTLYQAIISLNLVYAGWRNACVDLEHLTDLMDEAPRPALPVPEREGEATMEPASLVFQNVSFDYDGREILHALSFRAGPGETIALVGPTGAGKSTIARLILGAYAPASGQILLDGQDLASIPPVALHRMIGVVPQDTQLFNDTIGYNIAYGQLDATQAEIEEAARLAQIHDFIEGLENGYETLVGERGLKLSGGERQRIALARIILRKPRLLLLDEATSALDTGTELRLMDALRRVTSRQTTIAIAHRLSTIRHATRILVIEAGRIVEGGTHESLMARQGAYFGMVSNQSGPEA